MKTSSKIYICTHKDFEDCPTDNFYEIIGANLSKEYPIDVTIEEDNELTPLQPFLGEWTRMRYIWKHLDDDLKYIGFCHYDRYFKIKSADEIENIFKDHSIITTKPLAVGNMANQYANCHNLETLYNVCKCSDEINEDTFKRYLQTPFLFSCNMFIMKKEDFCDYCKFIDDIMTKYIANYNFKNMEDVNDYIKANAKDFLKSFYPNNTVQYQARFGGFIIERLTTLYILLHYSKSQIKTIETIEYEHER